MIKVILWDIDGTLLDFLAAERAAIRRCFEIFGLGTCTDAMLEDYSAINVKHWQMLERNERTKPEILVGRFQEFFSKYGLDTSVVSAFNDEYQIRLGDTIVFRPGAMETLQALRGRVVQCAVTNGTRIAQERKLELSGLNQILDYIFISEDVGVEKPNLAFFDRVFAEIGTYAPHEVLIVGDSLTSDIRGGNNAGILTCWFNPEGKENGLGVHVDHEITRIDQVLGLL